MANLINKFRVNGTEYKMDYESLENLPDLSTYAQKSELEGFITQDTLSSYAQTSDLDGYVSNDFLSGYTNYSNIGEVIEAVAGSSGGSGGADLTGYATKEELNGYLSTGFLGMYSACSDITEVIDNTAVPIQFLSGYTSYSQIGEILAGYAEKTELSDYAKAEDLHNYLGDELDAYLSAIGVGNSVLDNYGYINQEGLGDALDTYLSANASATTVFEEYGFIKDIGSALDEYLSSYTGSESALDRYGYIKDIGDALDDYLINFDDETYEDNVLYQYGYVNKNHSAEVEDFLQENDIVTASAFGSTLESYLSNGGSALDDWGYLDSGFLEGMGLSDARDLGTYLSSNYLSTDGLAAYLSNNNYLSSTGFGTELNNYLSYGGTALDDQGYLRKDYLTNYGISDATDIMTYLSNNYATISGLESSSGYLSNYVSAGGFGDALSAYLGFDGAALSAWMSDNAQYVYNTISQYINSAT